MTELGAYLDEAVLLPYLKREVPSIGAVHDIARITSGSSNELFELSADAGPVILRRPPRQRLSASAHDVAREFRVLSALDGTLVPHPDPIHLCPDDSVLGMPFLLMSKVEGFHLKAPYPATRPRQNGAMRAMMLDFIEVIARLSRVDWAGRGTDRVRPSRGLSRPPGRSLARATRRLPDAESCPSSAEVASWLRAHQPESGPPGIIHGDYQFLNVLFANDLPPRVAGVLDWEQSTIGDPLVDLGWVLGLWTAAGEESPLNAFYGNAEPASRRADPGRARRSATRRCPAGSRVIGRLLRGPGAVQARLHRRGLLLPAHQGRQRHHAARRLRVDRAQADIDRLPDHRGRARLVGWGSQSRSTAFRSPGIRSCTGSWPTRAIPDLWSAESNGADGFTPLALAAAAEPRLRLGTAIVSSFTRGPALLAQSAAAMAAAAPGRFVLGLGASSDVIVRQLERHPLRQALFAHSGHGQVPAHGAGRRACQRSTTAPSR